ncbi:hypothetical protein [Dysgonomonas sp. GY617]|uniref:hypothetical protein n=1 Tax=Dysgonomonas sp. GY617 TaxID=2780420 RepID=UPI0018847D02|nr:hypothetical protein [Dysgonomonas sp. GY617]MBF0576631.1 hypothetical protein [Dysgonomonas sp. GY617]
MKIKLSEKQWKQVIDSLNASDDVEMLATAKPIERIINKINKEIAPKEVKASSIGRGWGVMMLDIDTRSIFGYDLEFSTNDAEIIINALNENIETKRDEIDDEVVAIDANDSDEPINDIKEHLSDALKKANEVENLEAIREGIEAQQDEQKENEKDNKIVELTAKVDTMQMSINGKNGEIDRLRSRINDADNYIGELSHRLGRYEPTPRMRGCSCPSCRPPFDRRFL